MIEQSVVEYVANALWQIPLLAAGAWLLLAAVKAGPRMQYGVWVAALLLAVLIPLRGMGEARAVAVEARDAAMQSHRSTGGEAALRVATVNTDTKAEAPARQGGWNGWLPYCSHRLEVPQAVVRWMAGLYAAVVMFGLYRVLSAWHAARRLVDRSREVALGGQQTVVLEDYGRRLRIRLPEVRESVEVESPVIVGAVSPVLLLPERFGAYREEEIRAALLHELAHVKRRDYMVNAMCHVAALPVFWHPVTHWMQARVRQTQEMACDGMAATEMRSEIGYARCLVAMARSMMTGGAKQTAAVGLFSNNVLEERVMRLMETKTAMGLRTKVVRVTGGATAMMAAAAMAVVFHVTPTMAATGQDAIQAAVTTEGSQPATAAAPRRDAREHADRVSQDTVQPKQRAKRTSVRSDCPEFRKEVEKARAEAEKTREMVNSPAFQKQMADAKAEADKVQAVVNSPEFKKQIADAQAQAEKAQELVNSEAFKEQMAQVKVEMAKVNVDMPRIQEEVRLATAQINSQEFQRQMEEVKHLDMHDIHVIVNEGICKQEEEGKKAAEAPKK